MNVKAEIAIEIDQALDTLGAAPAGNTSAAAVYETMREQGAKSDLLTIVGSWGDTMDDEWVLRNLRRWNRDQKRKEPAAS